MPQTVLEFSAHVTAAVPRRMAAHAFDWVFGGLLCLIWLAWFWSASEHGQTPGKKLLSLQVVDAATGRPAGRARMFARELLLKVVPLASLPLLMTLTPPAGVDGRLASFAAAGFAHAAYAAWVFLGRRPQAPCDQIARTRVLPVGTPHGGRLQGAAEIA